MRGTGKTIFLTVLLASAIVGFVVYSSGIIRSTSERLASKVSMIESGMAARNWSNAEQVIPVLHEDWRKTKKTWGMLIDHTEIDNIDAALTRLEKYMEAREFSLSMAEISLLRQYMMHLPEKESLKMENIF
jgi:hypothetical protein